jgi:hypothetical protein
MTDCLGSSSEKPDGHDLEPEALERLDVLAVAGDGPPMMPSIVGTLGP